MGWFATVALIALVLFWLGRLAGFRGVRLEWLGATLLVGLAGYAWQGSPVLGGSPTSERREIPPEGSADLDTDLVDPANNSPAARWTMIAESRNRAGDHLNAAHLIRNGIETDPDNADLWVSLGNALLLHGEGRMNPAAQLAFERAARLNPDHPGPPFFLGLALAQAGQFAQAQQTWNALLARTPDDAPYRADLEQRLLGLQRAMQQRAPTGD